MVKIINDIHANEKLLEELWETDFQPGDILVLNGDISGSRGPRLSEVVKVYYEVRRGESDKKVLETIVGLIVSRDLGLSDELVFKSIHSGTFQKALADKYKSFRNVIEKELRQNLSILEKICEYVIPLGVEVFYLSGNGEITALDFDVTGGVDKEVTVSPLERHYNQLALRGVFGEMGLFYANYPRLINEDTLVLPIDYVDIWLSENAQSVFDVKRVRKVITHYPPYDETMLRVFENVMNYEENSLGQARMKAVREILDKCPNLKMVIFGHVHRGTSKEEVAKLPLSMEFEMKQYRCIWNRPGHVYELPNF